MKESTSLLTVPAAIAAVLFTLVLWIPHATAQQTISLGDLISRGFTNAPSAGYSVTGVRGISPFVLTNIYALEAHAGSMTVFGLKFPVSSAKVETNRLKVEGNLELENPYKVPGVTNLSIKSASAILQFDTNGFEKVANASSEICYEPKDGFDIGKLSLTEFCLKIDAALQEFGGTAKLEMNVAPGRDPCDPTSTNMEFEVGLQIKQRKLDSLSIGVKGLRKPLGTSGAFLDEISGTLGGLADDGNWYIEAGMVANAGCPIKIKDEDTYPITIEAVGKVTAAAYVEIYGTGKVFGITVANTGFQYTPPFDVSADAHVSFIPDYPVFSADCNFELQDGRFSGEARGKLQIPPSTPLVGGWQIANTYAAVDNNGFQGSFTINVSPEIPPIHIDRYCPPSIPYWYPCRWWRMCSGSVGLPCIGPFDTPGIPAVTAHVGFKFRSGAFSWDETADDQVEAWELSYRHVITDAATGNRMWFMSNYDRRDKASTGSKGRPFTKDDGGNPVTTFTVPEGEQNVIFRLTYQNTSAPRVAMGLQVPHGDLLDVNGGPLPNGYTNDLYTNFLAQGSYAEVLIRPASANPPTPAFGEAFFSLPKPKPGQYTVIIFNDKALGNFAVEYLRQNIAPTVALNSVQTTGGDYRVNFTSVITERAPTTRIYLCKMGDKGQTKAGPRYLVDEFPSASGTNLSRTIYTNYTSVNPGFYRVAVNIDDPFSQQAEALSSEEIFVDNPLVPQPVEHMVGLARNQKFDLAWVTSTSPNVVAYMVRYTKSSQPADFEYQKTVGSQPSYGNVIHTTVDGLTNGQPYLVTVVAVSKEGFQSKMGPLTRVVPTEGFGLTLPAMLSPSDQVAVVGSNYVYRPRIFWGDAEINQLLASDLIPGGADAYIRQLINLIDNYPAMLASGIGSITIAGNYLGFPYSFPLTDVYPGWTNLFDSSFNSGVCVPQAALTLAGITNISDITNLVDMLFVAAPLLEWDLIYPPPGMTIDASGLVSWTPAATNVGPTNVTIRASLPDFGGSRLSVLQFFPLTVVEAKYKNTSGRKTEPRTLFAEPITKAYAGRIYSYLPILGGDAYTNSLVQGPAGMKIRQVPDPRNVTMTLTNVNVVVEIQVGPYTVSVAVPIPCYRIDFSTVDVVYWDVPTNSISQGVRLRAVPKNIASPTEDDYVFQDYYLQVVPAAADLLLAPLPQPIEINRLEHTTANGVGLTWAGPSGPKVIMRSEDLRTWQPIGADPGLPIPALLGPLNLPIGSGAFRDPDPPPGKAFYRIVGQ
jgi:hypothetical protein